MVYEKIMWHKMDDEVKHYAAWIPIKHPSDVHRFIPSEFLYAQEHVLYYQIKVIR